MGGLSVTSLDSFYTLTNWSGRAIQSRCMLRLPPRLPAAAKVGTSEQGRFELDTEPHAVAASLQPDSVNSLTVSLETLHPDCSKKNLDICRSRPRQGSTPRPVTSTQNLFEPACSTFMRPFSSMPVRFWRSIGFVKCLLP